MIQENETKGARILKLELVEKNSNGIEWFFWG